MSGVVAQDLLGLSTGAFLKNRRNRLEDAAQMPGAT
jgi:hypothetical protein